MITSEDKLKLICNYEKKAVQSKAAQLSYMSFITSDDEKYLLEQKRINRELKIDVLTGEKDPKELDNLNPFSNDTIPTTSPQIQSITILHDKFKNYDDLYDKVIYFLDQNSKTPKKLKTLNTNNINVKLKNETWLSDNENIQTNSRRILTKINMSSSIIAFNGRIGPGTSVIYGKNLIEYFDYIESLMSNFSYIYNENIDPNKVIVCRSNTISDQGIIVIDSSDTGMYFMKETPMWDKHYSWFWVK